MDKSKLKVGFISTYPPRKCGIATFCYSISTTLDQYFLKKESKVIALNDLANNYIYPKKVIFEIGEKAEKEYRNAAEFINSSDIDVVSVQHEYGIFGGEEGEHILHLLEEIQKPVVINFHTVLPNGIKNKRHLVTQRIINLSDRIIVMTRNAKRILLENYEIKAEKIKIIPHGVPNIRLADKNIAKKTLNLEGKTVACTFGLINRGKGISFAIKAAAKIIESFPNFVYLILGTTHPSVKRIEGEGYRKELVELVRSLGIEKNVFFVNRFLSSKELVKYLSATDIYLAPQLDLAQAFSGTLSYAIGCGCATISSPTNYAKELLSTNRGILVDADEMEIASKILKLLKSPRSLEKLKLNSYSHGRSMIWPVVGLSYLKVFEEVKQSFGPKWRQRLPDTKKIPATTFLKRMTDNFGLVQHGKKLEPNYNFGYSLDDQARALIACTKFLKINPDQKEVKSLLLIYLNYLEKAVDKFGKVHNFIDSNFQYADSEGSDDSTARSFWALCYLFKNNYDNPDEVKKIIQKYEKVLKTKYIHPVAYALLGFVCLNERKKVEILADRIVEIYNKNSDFGWHWFEQNLTWGNGIIPYSLLKAYEITGKEDYLRIAIESAEFLEQASKGQLIFLSKKVSVPSPIGQNGWYPKRKKKAIFDQQSLEAGDMTILYNELFKITKEKKYQKKAQYWLGWYHGNNIKSMNIYDSMSEGVFDALTPRGINPNQGAESNVVYMMARLSFYDGL